MPPQLFITLEGRIPIHAHDHVAVLYPDHAAAFRFASFLAEGLERGDWCLYLAPANFRKRMLEEIRTLEVDPDRFLKSHTLRMDGGLADFAALRRRTQQTFADAEHARAPAIRWLEEGSWAESAGFPLSQFFEFHALLNYQVKHYRSAALCQYRLDQMEPRHLFSAIATHRHLLIGDTLIRDNPFYIPAEKFIPLGEKERLHDLTQAFREIGFDVDALLAALKGYGRLPAGTSGPA